MVHFIFRTVIITFAIITALSVFNTYLWRRVDVRINNETDHAIALAHNRLEQTHELFYELRPHLDVLSASDELFQREVYAVPSLLFTPDEEQFFSAMDWANIPWLAPGELEAISNTLSEDIVGARGQSIAFTEDAMMVTIFATPLHSKTGVNAWLGISYRDSVLMFPDHQVIMLEPLDGDWYLTMYALNPSSRAVTSLIATIILAGVTLIFLSIFLWGTGTKRFV